VTAKANLVRSGWGQGCASGITTTMVSWIFLLPITARMCCIATMEMARSLTSLVNRGCSRPKIIGTQARLFSIYDRDGHLDLIVSNYVGYDSGLALYDSDPSLVGVQSPVLHGPLGLQGSKNILYHNNGDGTFTDVSKAVGIANSEATYGFTPCVADYDNDGWPEYLCCERFHSEPACSRTITWDFY